MSEWQQYQRVGVVCAEPVGAEGATWQASQGDSLTASPGDYWVWSPDNPSARWSIKASELAATYRPIGDGRYEKTGTVDARVGIEGEVIESLEGPVTVGRGDMVVRAPSGATWPVPAERFAQSYRPTTT